MIDGRELTRRAIELVTLDADGRNVTAHQDVAQIMSEFGVTKARANTAVGRAARLLRGQRFADDDEAATFVLRVRLTERQRQHLQILADRETGGDMSKFVRRRVFA